VTWFASGVVRESRYARQQLAVRLGALVFAAKVDDVWPFGPLGRAEEPRRTYAGTYDDAWRRDRMPLLPVDFDARYHFSVPGSQLLGTYADGDEALALANFHGQSRIDSRLPGNAVVVSSDLLGDYFTRIADLDTVIVWSSARKFSSCGAWRFDHG
jgi:hypothetical protein